MICAWRWRDGFMQELAVGDEGFRNSALSRYLGFSLRTFVPVVLLFVFINSVAQKYFAVDLLRLFAS